MARIVLPRGTSSTVEIEKSIVNKGLHLSTTKGLVKKVNEDRVGCVEEGKFIRICVADGHWGGGAADITVKFWNSIAKFPKNKNEAVRLTEHLQKKLFEKFGQQKMDETKDFTPETSFLVLEVSEGNIKLLSYGDCRLLVCRKGKVKYELGTKQTWLGAFSHLGLRKRLKVEETLIFTNMKLKAGDTILAFSDGIDECRYEQQTIKPNQLASLADVADLQKIVDEIYSRVFAEGAEDNASLVVLRTETKH
ncbi:MAG: PP2C family serine/threonine-protein phosphatase [Patescibacteria group bacterium]